eukprot:5520580-Pleurochrysis_carterae.AAC.1
MEAAASKELGAGRGRASGSDRKGVVVIPPANTAADRCMRNAKTACTPICSPDVRTLGHLLHQSHQEDATTGAGLLPHCKSRTQSEWVPTIAESGLWNTGRGGTGSALGRKGGVRAGAPAKSSEK